MYKRQPQSEAVSAKWGAVAPHQVVISSSLLCFGLLIELIFLFEPFIKFYSVGDLFVFIGSPSCAAPGP